MDYTDAYLEEKKKGKKITIIGDDNPFDNSALTILGTGNIGIGMKEEDEKNVITIQTSMYSNVVTTCTTTQY